MTVVGPSGASAASVAPSCWSVALGVLSCARDGVGAADEAPAASEVAVACWADVSAYWALSSLSSFLPLLRSIVWVVGRCPVIIPISAPWNVRQGGLGGA